MTTEQYVPMTKDQQGADLRTTLAVALHHAMTPVEKMARVWKTEADRRLALRNEDALSVLRDANRDRLEALRDLRRDRKAFEKARDEVQWYNVVNGERRAARMVVRDSRAAVREATAARKEAQRAYPILLPSLAARCHAAYLGTTAFWVAFDGSYPSVAAFTFGAVAALANVTLIPLGLRRLPDTETDHALEALQPSQEERDLLRRLEPKMFARCTEPRGLSDVLSSGATLTASGITAKLTLNGSMTLTKLKAAEAPLRAALRLREGTRLELREGKTGGHARLTLRTRSAADGVALTGWQPGAPWGVNTVTGEPFPVPLGRRMLIAGTSGSGKSWSARPVLAEASEADDHALVVLDMKRVEARLWRKRARIAVTPVEIRRVLRALVEEMYERLDLIPDGEDVVRVSPELPRLTVFVDEGSELISTAKADKKEFGSIIEDLRTLARMGRAAEIIIVWATQKPMLSGDSPGLDTQVAAQITCRMSLAVSTSSESMVVFGDDAISEGWLAHKLPMPGVALLRDSNTAQPQHLRMRAMSPKDVMDLPARTPWERGARKQLPDEQVVNGPEGGADDPWDSLTVLGTAEPVLMPTLTFSDDEPVLAALMTQPCVTAKDLAVILKISERVASRALERLAAEGVVELDENGCWSAL